MYKIILLYILLLPCVALFLHYKYKVAADTAAVAWKAACTTLIVLYAIFGTAYVQEDLRVYAVLVSFGLTLGLVGDVVICQKTPASFLAEMVLHPRDSGTVSGGFLAGMLYFALGHLCYIAAFWRVSRHLGWAVPIFVVIYLAMVVVAYVLKLQGNSMLLPVALYCAVITAMVSLAVTTVFSTSGGWMLLVGAVLFAVSDGILAYGVFKGDKVQWIGSFGLYCYFIGQSLFAVSIFFLGK